MPPLIVRGGGAQYRRGVRKWDRQEFDESISQRSGSACPSEEKPQSKEKFVFST